MPRDTHILSSSDPLSSYAHAAVISGTQRPVPLTGTKISVRVDGGLATVTTTRTFRNDEDASIEATMTFPAPVHATLLKLSACIDGRTVVGSAKRHQKARETYEAGIDAGKTAILHEEKLRGVHMISVGHIAPGKEISVTGTWAMAVAATGKGALLRIPVTVGEIYGRSPLSDADDLAHGGVLQEADLDVTCSSGMAYLLGGGRIDGKSARVRLDAPIDLDLVDIRLGMLRGVAADGRPVALDIRPAQPGLLPLDAAVMMDRSGSMDQPAAGYGQEARGRGLTKHQAGIAGLREAAKATSERDQVDVWHFDDDAEHVKGRGFADAVEHMRGTQGGTRVGRSLKQVLGARETRDILLVTDGKSHDLDVQEAARSGRRIHVVLVGEDSLEANVGHLAALTGGQLFIVAGTDVGSAIRQAFDAMRQPKGAHPATEGAPLRAEAALGGMVVRAAWGDAAAGDDVHVVGFSVPTMITGSGNDGVPAVPGAKSAGEGPVIEGASDAELSRSVAAVAASLAIPSMTEDAAAALAEAEGIVCHLTSLVLVDEEGEAQEGIPAQRKVATMSPRTMAAGASFMAVSQSALAPSGRAARQFMAASASVARGPSLMAAPGAGGMFRSMGMAPRYSAGGLGDTGGFLPPGRARTAPDAGYGWGDNVSGIPETPLFAPLPAVSVDPPAQGDLKWALGGVDWTMNPDALRKGDLRGVSARAAQALVAVASMAAVTELASRLGISALAVAVGLLARHEGAKDRTAARVARAVFAKASDAELDTASRAAGL